jgi:hypothetical protein
MADRPTNEEVVRQYAEASAAQDLETLQRLRHADWMVEWPQSGERVHGSDAFAEIIRNYPGGRPRAEVTRIVGAEDRWVMTPGNTVMRVAGSGDFWWSEWRMIYPDEATYRCVSLMRLLDGRIHRETVYWGPPFEAPDWRRPWVEVPDGSSG